MRIGVDMVSVSRIAHSLSVSAGFAQTVFANSELEYAMRLPEHRGHEYLAGRFAVKEAVLKALHRGIEAPLMMKEIEAVSQADGRPSLQLTGSVAQIAHEIGLSDWQVSISHEENYAVAFVLLS